jgi:hypothetical protein
MYVHIYCTWVESREKKPEALLVVFFILHVKRDGEQLSKGVMIERRMKYLSEKRTMLRPKH